MALKVIESEGCLMCQEISLADSESFAEQTRTPEALANCSPVVGAQRQPWG